jgi:hypothetical protein
MEFELGKKQDMKAVEEILKTKLAHLFEMELV